MVKGSNATHRLLNQTKVLSSDHACKLIKSISIKKPTPLHLQRIWDIYQRTEQHKSPNLINLVLRICVQSHQIPQSVTIFDDIRGHEQQHAIQLPLFLQCLLTSDDIQSINQCIFILQWIANHVQKVNPNDVSKLISKCSTATQLQSIHSVLSAHPILNHEMSLKISLINALGKRSETRCAMQIFSEIHPNSMTAVAIGSMMKVLVTNKSYSSALDIYHQHSHFHNDIIHNLALTACIQLNDFQTGKSIHQSLAAITDTNIHLKCALIHFYGHFNQIQPAEDLFLSIKSDHFTPICTGTMMKAFIDCGHHCDAIKLHHKSKGTLTNDICHLLAIKAYTESNRLSECLEFIKSLNISQNTDIQLLNVILKFHGDSGDIESAERVFTLISDSKSDVNIYSVCTMMSAYIQNDDGLKALGLYDGTPSSVRNDVSNLLAVKACIATDNEQRGRDIHRGLSEKEMSNELKHQMITFYGHFGDIESAMDMFVSIGDKRKETVSFNAMMEVFADHNWNWECYQLFQQLMNEYTHLNADCITFAIVIKCCTQEPFIQIGQDVHRMLNEEGRQWMLKDLSIRINLINMYGVFGMMDVCESLFEGMRVIRDGDNKELAVWNAMMNAYGRNGEADGALEIFERMKKIGVIPDKTSFVLLMNVLGHCGKVDVAMDVWERIKDENVKFDHVLITTLVDSLARAGNRDLANDFISRFENRASNKCND